MKISQKSWKSYIDKLSKIDKTAAEKVAEYYRANPDISMNELIYYAYNVSSYYGEAAGELACEMYDEVATTAKRVIPPAEPARTATYGEIAGAVASVLSYTKNADVIGAEVGKSVKKVSLETIKNNALRDGAEFAWVPSGDTCAFCIMLASNGWRRASKKAIRGGHKEHVHSNCDCTYAVRFDPNTEVEGYDPEYYLDIYDNAEGYNWQDKVNSMRRDHYAANREKINEQKRLAYANRKNQGLAKASARFVNQHELLFRNSAKVEKLPKFDDFICHGTPDGFFINLDEKKNVVYYMTPKEYAARIKKSKEFKGNDIRIISCQTGKYENGAAQQLANELRVNVYAPTEVVNIDEDGNIFVSDNDILADMWYNAKKEDKDKFVETGSWILFKPKLERR